MSTILSQTVALVTGGASGLGAATATYLLRQGARVLVGDLGSQYEKFVQLAQLNCVPISDSLTEQQGPGLAFAETDVTIADQVEAALDKVGRVFGEPVNASINCAGIAMAHKTLSKKGLHSLDSFGKILMVNTMGTFNVARLAAERMSRREAVDGLRGCIIHTASIAAFEGQIGQVAYAASKGGVVGMTLPMARDLAPLGIRVMTIVSLRCGTTFYMHPVSHETLCSLEQAPGLFATALLDGLPENVKAELGSTVPCPSRLGIPDEFGQLVGSILSNPMLNGSVIRLDGALRMPP
jgi:3-hydroxyacyl-CoA dehydrogenase / 3-hydroxy-2-methylbutyryl-CoA dehydrogenase